MLKYYKNTVKYNKNIPYGIGIITGWKHPEAILNNLNIESKNKVITCGNLYTKNGINYIIANLFLNPHITELIVLKDSSIKSKMADSCEAFLKFLETKETTFELKFDFTKEQLEEFATYYQKHTKVVRRKDLNQIIPSLKIKECPWCKMTDIKEKELELNRRIPSEKIGFLIRANTAYEAWNRALKLIHSYGYLKPSAYDEQQLELMNLSMIVKSEDINNPSMIGNLDITKEELLEYEKSILSPEKPDGVKYTYGNRYRNIDEKDQFKYMVETLKEQSYSRRAVASLWIPQIDIEADEGPCIDLYQAIIEGEYLYLIAYLRANDVYNGWPRNIYGILKIQEELCKELNCKKGYVNTIAGSAHVYSRNFNDIEERYKNRKVSFCEEDERGYFTVSLEDKKIKVAFYTRTGEEIYNFYGKSAKKLRDKCTFCISNIDHAFYLGQELMKAEIALQNNLTYIQDQNIKIKKK